MVYLLFIDIFCVCLCIVGPDIRCAELIQEWGTLEKYCEVTGNPVPAVKWLKGEQPINRTMPLSRENAGTYVIEAEGAFVTKKDIHVLISCEFPVMSCADCLGFSVFHFCQRAGIFFS